MHSSRFVARQWILWLVLGLAAGGTHAVDMDALRREGFEQMSRWIVSRDEEKRRSAAESLGSYSEDARSVTLLAAALTDRDVEVRRLAAASLWKLGDAKVDTSAATGALRPLLSDASPAVRVQAAGALERAGAAPADLVAARRSVLAEGDWFDKALAARDLIGLVDGAELVEPLLQSMRDTPAGSDEDDFDARDVLEPLVQRGGASVVPGLMQALSDPRLRKAPLIDALGTLESPPEGWRDALLRTARGPDADARESAARQMRALVQRRQVGPDWVPAMLPLLQDPEAGVRDAACELFAAAAGDAHAAVDPLLALIARENDEGVRRSAIRALGAIGNATESYDRDIKASVATRVRPALEVIARDAGASEDVREDAQAALQAIDSGKATGTKVLTTSAPGDAGALQRLRDRNVEFTEDSFWRALGERDEQTVRDLLDGGLPPHSISANGMPALHFMVMSGCDYGQPTADATLRIVALLIQRGADPNQREVGGDNPALHRATSCDGALVRQLVAAKADVRARNASELTAFPIFVITSPSGAAALLDAGYRADAKERVTVQAMLDGEKDPEKRRLLTRALGGKP